MDLRHFNEPFDQSKLKTFWKGGFKHQIWSFICPLCQVSRKVPFHPQPQLRHYIQIFLTAGFFTLLTWKFFHWRGLVSFVPFWTIFEIIYRYQARAALYCKKCGFDPYLFMVDSDLAKTEVETHWRKKLGDKGIPYPEPQKRVKKKHLPESGSDFNFPNL